MQVASHTTVLVPRPPWGGGSAPRWIHALAVLTVLATCALLFLGAEVTTKGVGMADQRSVVNPIQAIREFEGQSLGFKLEHTHRLAGWLVGFCGILLTAGLWLTERRQWVCWLGAAALLLIVAQGLLGIFRVQLNAILGPGLAWVHGSFAPIVFATLVSLALVTSPSWTKVADLDSPALRRWSLAMVGIVYLQLVVGGMVRHQPNMLAARGHLLGAFVTTAGLLWLATLAWQHLGIRWPVRILLALLGMQVLLGAESWMNWMPRLFIPLAAMDETTTQHWLRSAHYVVGAMLFAATVIVMLQAQRKAQSLEAAA